MLGLDKLASTKRENARKRLDDDDDRGVTESVRRGIEKLVDLNNDQFKIMYFTEFMKNIVTEMIVE